MITIHYIIGDSIAAGIAINGFKLARSGANGVKSTDSKGISQVGAPPKTILGFLNQIGKQKLTDKNVIISTGLSNNSTDLANIKNQLQLLKDVNAKVFIIGVSNDPPSNIPGLRGGNDKLKNLATDFGFKFFGGFKPSSDKLHPVYGDYYKNVIKPVLESEPNPRPPATSGSSGTSGTSGTSGSSGTSGTSGSTPTPTELPVVKNDKLITGKIIITKKSGPGELTGINEAELTQVRNLDVTNAEFGGPGKELQFTEPGDYVLSITCTSDKFDPYELKVKVTKEEEFIAQESKDKGVEKSLDGTRPIIAQIDKPTIVVPPIKMDKDKTSGPIGPPETQSAYTNGMGYTPLIWYKAFAIEDRSLKYLRLYHDGLIPMIEFTFEDTKEILKGETTPKDDATIDFFLNSTSKNLKSIHMIFKIKDFIQGAAVAGQTYTITGTADIPSLYVQNNKSYRDTSFGALRKICKELGLGFNSNMKNTDDRMKWRNTNKKTYEFMDDIISRSYMSDDTYMVGYIDYYYCFNYVDVEKEWIRDASNDLGLDSSAMSEQSNPEEVERLVGLRLTNEQSQNSSSNYIGTYTTLNESTKKSLKDGYATITKTYDRLNKSFQVFVNESITSDGTETHILKGNQYSNLYKNENVKHKFLGKIDTDNVHVNYNYAVTQNRINLNDLNKIVVNAVLPNANWNLYKFMKIGVDLINPSSTPTNPSIRDHRYSGYYIIADIEYLWNGNNMFQQLRLVRKELGKTPEEVRNDPPFIRPPEVKENNFNPTGTSSIVPAPNEVYNVGQTYLVQDKSGKLYNLFVTSLLENGIEVTGTLKDSPIGLSNSTTSNLTTITEPTPTETTPTAPTGPVVTPTPVVTPVSTTPTEFAIGLLNPVSEADKKITGVVNITKQGPLQTATGIISGFPDNGTIGPIKGEPAGSEISAEQLVNEMIRKLESSITIKYNKDIKLTIISKK